MTSLTLLVSSFLAFITVPFVRVVAFRRNFISMPRSDRHHTSPTPMLGGIAIVLSIFFSTTVIFAAFPLISALLNQTASAVDSTTYAIAVGSILYFTLVGLLDDRLRFPPLQKLLLQSVGVLALVFVGNVRISLPLPFPTLTNGVLSYCWLMYVMNAYNYSDNMDGNAGMIGLICSIFFTLIAVINGQIELAILSVAIAGACASFLRYNLFGSPHYIFMGDAGSLPLGALLACIGILVRFRSDSPWITWPVPVIVLAIPLFDTAMVFFSRWRRHEPLFKGNVDHLSHRFSRLGMGRMGVPLAMGLSQALLGCLAIIVMNGSLLDSLIIQLTLAGLALLLLYRLELRAPPYLVTGKAAEPEPAAHAESSSSPV